LAWGCGLDLTGSGQGPVAGCCECGDEPSGSCSTELVRSYILPYQPPREVNPKIKSWSSRLGFGREANNLAP
jgi:hypothetical protein